MVESAGDACVEHGRSLVYSVITGAAELLGHAIDVDGLGLQRTSSSHDMFQLLPNRSHVELNMTKTGSEHETRFGRIEIGQACDEGQDVARN